MSIYDKCRMRTEEALMIRDRSLEAGDTNPVDNSYPKDESADHWIIIRTDYPGCPGEYRYLF